MYCKSAILSEAAEIDTRFPIPPTYKLPTKRSFAPFYKVTTMKEHTQTDKQYTI